MWFPSHDLLNTALLKHNTTWGYRGSVVEFRGLAANLSRAGTEPPFGRIK
jgi:hypothetical protein